MMDQDILNRLTQILRDLLSDDSIVLTMETKRDEVANWDSFAYVNFIVAVEIEFGLCDFAKDQCDFVYALAATEIKERPPNAVQLV
jgi:hypothetical protein